MAKRVVMISGRQGSGKTTTGRRLVEDLRACGYQAHSMKFADILYEMHHAIRAILKRCGADDLNGTDGTLLQVLGTEWGRKSRGEDLWVNCLLASAHDYWAQNPNSILVIDDCRFENEFRAFGRVDDVVVTQVRLVAPRETRRLRAEKWRDNETHPSECSMDAVDDSYFDVVADTSIESVNSIVGRILDETRRLKPQRPTSTA